MAEQEWEKPVYVISVVAEMLSTNQQTLRIYEKERLVAPRRTKKNTRLYSMRDVEELRRIIHLHQDLGVNLAGVEVILNMIRRMEDMQIEMQRLVDILRERFENDFSARSFDETCTDLVTIPKRTPVVTTRKRKK